MASCTWLPSLCPPDTYIAQMPAMTPEQGTATEVCPHICARAPHSSRATGCCPCLLRDHQANPSWSEWPLWREPDGIPVQLSWSHEPRLGDFQTRPERLHGLTDADVGIVPAAGLAGPGLGQHMSHSLIHAQARPCGQTVHALQPSHWRWT